MQPDLQSAVKTLLEAVFKKPLPDSTKNFFDLGLVDSLSAVNLLVTIEEKMGVSLDILDFSRREDYRLDRITACVQAAQKAHSAPQ